MVCILSHMVTMGKIKECTSYTRANESTANRVR